MKDCNKPDVPNDDENPNQTLANSSFEITSSPNLRLSPGTNQYTTEMNYTAFALGRLARVLIDIARNPRTQETETDSKD